MLVHHRRPTPIQYWEVFYACVSVSTEHSLTPTQRRINVGPASPTLASIHPFNTGQCTLHIGAHDCNAVYIRFTDPMPVQCWPTVCNAGTTPTSIISQRMPTRKKIMHVKAARVSAEQNQGAFNPKVGCCWGSGVNSGPALN